MPRMAVAGPTGEVVSCWAVVVVMSGSGSGWSQGFGDDGRWAV